LVPEHGGGTHPKGKVNVGFSWNEPLPAEIFKLEIPAGFAEKNE
jgi:hypothetical protein